MNLTRAYMFWTLKHNFLFLDDCPCIVHCPYQWDFYTNPIVVALN